VANNTYVTFADGRQVSIQGLGVPRGHSRYFTNVRLTKDKWFVCNLMVAWTTPKKPGEKPELYGDHELAPVSSVLERVSETHACRRKFSR